jgi:hypothetical protein
MDVVVHPIAALNTVCDCGGEAAPWDGDAALPPLGLPADR